MKKIILIMIGLLMIPLVSAIVKDYTIITCHQAGCEEDGICEPDGYCHYPDGSKERRSCVEIPELCREEDGRLCYTARDYPVCVFIKEQEVIIRDEEELYTGISSINFENAIRIGDKTIYSQRPEFTCNPQGENWNYPQPSIDCWEVSVTALGNNYIMKGGGEIGINECLNLKLNGMVANYNHCGEGEEDCTEGVKGGYTKYFTLSLTSDCISIEHTENNDYFIVKDSSNKLSFDIDNKLFNFNSEQAGFYIYTYKDIIEKEEKFYKENEIKFGKNRYYIGIDTSTYGEINYKIYTYFYLGDYQFFDDERLLFKFKIVDEENIIKDEEITEEDDATIMDYKSPDCIKDEECNDFDSKTTDKCVNNVCVNNGKSYLPFVFLILGVIVFFLIISKRR